MGKTALDLAQEEWQGYHPSAGSEQSETPERWERAWLVASTAAGLLRRRFGATRIVVFGSAAHRDGFIAWSDIDLAAWGIPPEFFYRAVAAVTAISSEFKVDLVDPNDCRPDLRRTIEREGVPL